MNVRNASINNLWTYICALFLLWYIVIIKIADGRARAFNRVGAKEGAAAGESFERDLMDIVLTQCALQKKRQETKDVKKKTKNKDVWAKMRSATGKVKKQNIVVAKLQPRRDVAARADFVPRYHRREQEVR